MLGFFNKAIETIFGKKSDKDIKELMPLVQQIKEVYPSFSGLSNDELRNKTNDFKARIAEYLSDIDEEINRLRSEVNDNEELDVYEKEKIYETIDGLIKDRDTQLEEVLMELLPQAFAVVKETARRFAESDGIEASATELDRDLSVNADYLEIEGDTVKYKKSWMAAGGEVSWNMVHYDVQLIGGIVLHQGRIAEMQTGEGKTLVATLPAYLNGITGQGVHVVTVNNYLAQRDMEWMRPLFNFLGLTIDCIDLYRPNSTERRKAYRADIVYGTNNEFGFDYLRDNMVRTQDEIVQRKHHFAMVDEVDSVLIDDARTPLIISGPVERGDEQQFDALKPRIERLFKVQQQLTRQFLVDAKKKINEGNTDPEQGGGGLDLLRAFRGLPKSKPLIKFLSEQGMKNILLKTENFYLQEQAKRMPEVDQELYFVIEEKNNQVNLTDKGIQYLTGQDEDQRFFVMTDIGSILSELEIADLSAEEKRQEKDKALQDFAIKSERLHAVQQLLKAYTMFEKDVEYVVMENKVKIVDEQTGRIMEGRRYSDGLHQAIEAKENVKVEAATQTFATITLQNFFRMYHKLAGMTGTAETEAGEFWQIYNLDVVVIPTNRPVARDDKQDLVFRTAREKYNAVIDEVEILRAQGRPTLVGTTSVDVSELLSRLLKLKGIDHNVLNAKQHAREADIVTEAGRAGQVTIATNMAGRGTDIKLSKEVKDAGGLAIIGTERHDSRRVDRQLRGRAGRQGDPGSSQFYVSLEDKLMRLFGSDRVAGIMDKMGYEEGEVIQHNMITKSIERAQKKVEENSFGVRKNLLDYDEVMNKQRNAVYMRRRHALSGERLSLDISNNFYDLAEEVVNAFHSDQDYEGFMLEVLTTFAIEPSFSEQDFGSKKANVLVDLLYQDVEAAYERKKAAILEEAIPVLQQVYQSRPSEEKTRIIVPFAGANKAINVVTNLQDAINTNGKTLIRDFEKSVSLGFIDETWKVHLRQMDDLKQSVQTARYEQKDPLLIYKQEAFGLFNAMVSELNQSITSFLFRASLPVKENEPLKEAHKPRRTDLSKLTASRASGSVATGGGRASQGGGNLDNPMAGASAGGSEKQVTAPIRRDMPKVKRNAPCPCGSGRKYKNCHGKKA